MKFTVFTPTYNRANTLPRLYNSLLNQTYKEFVWLIIDDGSTDNTKELVNKWIIENKITIDYHYKDNGGKHTAMRMAYQTIQTKYLLSVDSDDQITPDAVDVFEKEWKKIENENLENVFAEIRALTQQTNGKMIGNFHFPVEVDYFDSNWHEMVLKRKNNNELCVCWNVEKLRDCTQIPDKFWLSDKINFLGEFVLWARIGKKYKTRYINKKLYIVHYDGGESLLRITDQNKGQHNNLVGSKYFLDENLEYFLWNPKYFIHLLLKFIVSGIELDYSPVFILKNMQTIRFRVFYSFLYPGGFILWAYYKYIKKNFWF